MSGHSKWAQIKRQKGVADNKRSAVFTKLANAITVTVRDGGKDPELNFRLRLAMEKARAANMPKDSIERAIKRGAGEPGERPLENVTYEGYGPDGVAVVAEALTDNRHRTSAELRRVFSEHGGSLGNANSVLWMFEPRGYLEIVPSGDKNALELTLIDAGAEDFQESDGIVSVYTPPSMLARVREATAAAGAEVKNAELTLIATSEVTPSNLESKEKIQRLLFALEELDDVTTVATNANL